MVESFDATTLIAVTAIFMLGGFTKGVLGIGLPLTVVPLLTLFVPVPTTVAVMVLPILVSNVFQVFSGGSVGEAVRRFWPLIAALVIGIVAGTHILISLDQAVLYVLIGVAVTVFVALEVLRAGAPVSPRSQGWLGPVVGGVAGVLGGLSSIYGPPVVMYLVALRVGKDLFITAIGLVFLAGVIPLGLSLASLEVMGRDETLLSGYACLPVLAGMFFGQKVRRRLPQETFRNVVLVGLALIGLNLIRRGVGL